MKKFLLFQFIIFLLILFSNLYSEEIKKEQLIFITNQKNSIQEISKKDIKNIYLGKKKKWTNKIKIIPVLNSSENVEKEFYKLIGKTKTKYEKYWDKMVFTGKGNPPLKMENNVKIIDYIKKNEGAISFISIQDTISEKSIKILKIKNK